MNSKTGFPVLLLLGFLLVLIPATYFYIKQEQRHHLLCEMLKPGMSKEEVLSALRQVGDFTMSEGEWSGGDIVLSIDFTNPANRVRFGYFSVVFFDYKYERAVISHGSDNPEIICSFYQPIEATPDMPTQTP